MIREVGAPTEQDVLRIFGVTWEELGLHPVTLRGEEGANIVIYPIYLDGITHASYASIRKLKIACKVGVVHDEAFLTPQNQVMMEQGSSWLNHLNDTQVTKRGELLKEAGKKKNSKVVMSNWEALEAKAAQILATRVASMQQTYEQTKEESEKDKEEEEDDDEDAESNIRDHGYGEAPAKRKPNRQRAIVQDPTLALAESLGQQGAVEDKRRKLAKAKCQQSKRKSKKKGDKDKDESSEVEADSQMREEFTMNLDADMKEVSARHQEITGKTSVCFANLNVAKFLNGEKLGQSIVGVT